MQSFFDTSEIHSNERTLILDLSVIPTTKEDQFDDELIFQQLTLLQSQEAIKEKDNDESVVKAARQLKKKVITLLEKYSSMLTQKDISIRKVIIEDLRIINQEYQQLLLLSDEVENISHEVQMIVKLVGEFLQKMKVKQTEKQNEQCSKTQPEQQRRTNRVNTYEMCSSEPFKKQQSLPQQQQLSSNSYESDESTTISNKTITALNNKILKIISILQPNMQYNKIINLSYEILNSSENMETFKQLRQLSKQFDEPEVKKLVKACYLKSLVQEQSQNNTSKREFYDLVIKIKSQVPENNKLHSMMISSLYDEVVKKGVPNSEWETYMKQLCN